MSSVPSDRVYSKTHEWFKAEGDVVTVGITQFAADELTDITFVDLPAPGSRVEPGAGCGEIESVKATSELYTAVGGEIIEINETLADAPEQVNDDPFNAGWMVRIRAADVGPLGALMSAEAYEAMLASG